MVLKRSLAALIVSTALLGAVACGGTGFFPDGTPGPKVGTAVDGTQLTGAALEVQTYMRNLQKQKSYRVQIASEINGAKLDSMLEVEAPDRLHLVLGGGGALNTTEQIAIGATSYTKQSGRWAKDANGGIAFDPKELATSLEGLATSAAVTKGNVDAVNGKACRLYQIDNPKTGSSNQLCVADNLPLRLTTTGSTIFGNATILFSDFGAKFGIKAPV